MSEQGDNELLHRIHLAEHGDDRATGQLCAEAGRALRCGTPLHPLLQAYIAGALQRVPEGGLLRAFAPLGRQPPEITSARRDMNDMALVYWVDRAIAAGKATSIDGDPGPAFADLASHMGKSPATVRDRYYQVRDKIRGFCKTCENP
jgi:hypothetical protein